MIDRPRDDKGLFKPSGIKSFTGSRVCRRCNVEEMLNIIGPAVRAVQKFREANKP